MAGYLQITITQGFPYGNLQLKFPLSGQQIVCMLICDHHFIVHMFVQIVLHKTFVCCQLFSATDSGVRDQVGVRCLCYLFHRPVVFVWRKVSNQSSIRALRAQLICQLCVRTVGIEYSHWSAVSVPQWQCNGTIIADINLSDWYSSLCYWSVGRVEWAVLLVPNTLSDP